MAGVCNTIQVTIEEDNTICVADNGRGIPTGIHPKLGRPAVEVCLTVLHAGGKFGGGGYKVSGGLHGVGMSVVNALSTWLEVTVAQNGNLYRQEYERGVPLYDLNVVGKSEAHGTTIRFRPDPEIFEDVTAYSFDTLKKRLRELAFLNAGIRIELTDKRGEGQSRVFPTRAASAPSSSTSTRTARRSSPSRCSSPASRTARPSRSRCSTTTPTRRTSSASPTTSTRSRAARTWRASAGR